MLRHAAVAVGSVVLLLALPDRASASLIGDSIICSATWLNAPDGPVGLLNNETGVVSGIEAEFSVTVGDLVGSEFRVDFNADNTFSILFSPAAIGTWGADLGIMIEDIDLPNAARLTSVVRVSTTPFSPGFLNFISFSSNESGNTIRIQSSANDYETGSWFQATYAYTMTPTDNATVPEPASLLLMGVGAAIATVRRSVRPARRSER